MKKEALKMHWVFMKGIGKCYGFLDRWGWYHNYIVGFIMSHIGMKNWKVWARRIIDFNSNISIYLIPAVLLWLILT